MSGAAAGPPRSWVALLALFTVAGLIESVSWGQLAAFMPMYLASVGVRAGDVAWCTGAVTGVGSAVGILVLPLWGALADRYARKPVIVRSFAAYLAGYTIVTLFANVAGLTVGRTLMGLSMGNSGLMMATLRDRVPARRAGLSLAVFNSAPPLGAFIGPLAAGPLVDAHGARALFALNAGLMALVTASLVWGYRDEYHPRDTRPVLVLARESLGLVARAKQLRGLFFALFLLFGGWMLANLYLPFVVAERFPVDKLATRIGLVLAGGGLGTVLLAPSLGALADRRDPWRVLLIAGLVEAVSWVPLALAPTFSSFAFAWGLANGLASGVFALAFGVLSEAAPDDARGRVMAYAYLPSTAGYALASALGSVASSGVTRWVFYAVAVLTALGCAALVRARTLPSVIESA